MFIFILFYLGLQFLIGYWVSKQIKSEDDFLLAGRRLPTWLLTFSLFATWFGAETCIGTSGAVYEHGLSGSRADPFGYTICLFLVGLLLARRLWNGGFTTLADFFRQRYGVMIEKIAVCLLIPSSLFWGGAQIRAFGQVIASSTDMPVNLTIVLAFFVVVAYTLMGGLMGDIVTDLLQGIIIIVGLVGIFVVIFYQGFTITPDLLTPERLSFAAPGESFLQRLDRWLIPILGSLVAQELISRILAAKDAKSARSASFYSSAVYIVIGAIPVLLGLIGPKLLPGVTDKEQFLVLLAHKYLPKYIVMIFVASLISAILATIDSILLASGALLAHNLLMPWVKPTSEKQKLRWTRGSVIFMGLLSFIIAFFSDGIYELVEIASSFGTSGILVITFIGLWSHFGHRWSAIIALATGLVALPMGQHVLDWEAPFASSILLAFIAYTTTALVFERNWQSKSTSSNNLEDNYQLATSVE